MAGSLTFYFLKAEAEGSEPFLLLMVSAVYVPIKHCFAVFDKCCYAVFSFSFNSKYATTTLKHACSLEEKLFQT